MPVQSTPEPVVINLRADHARRTLIDKAASVLGKNRSEFMLDAACREAASVLVDQRFFGLDAKRFQQFSEALDKPASSNPRLSRLLSRKAPWDPRDR